MSQNRILAAAAVIGCAHFAMAQTGNFARWEVSLDNGATWHNGAVSAPQTQTSALVRLRWQHLTNGLVTPVADRVVTFDAATFEGYVTTSAPTGDTASSFQRMFLTMLQTPILAPASSLITSRRVGNVLGIDRVNDNAPLGGNFGVFVENRLNGLFTPTLQQDIALMQYTLDLDGSAGDRVLSGLFIPFNTQRPFSLGLDQISVASVTTNTYAPADITHLPTTLTIIPAPTSVGFIVCGAALASRRRRG